jgi:hypothetical protein
MVRVDSPPLICPGRGVSAEEVSGQMSEVREGIGVHGYLT